MNAKLFTSKTIIRVGELKLVGYRVLCPSDEYSVEIPKAAKRLADEIGKIKHLVNPSVQIGAFVVDANRDAEDGYWVCMEVEQYEDIPDGMVALTIPAQTYAVWNHQGANIEIIAAYEKLHNWMEENNYKRLTSTWHLEIFNKWNDPQNIDVMLLDTMQEVK